MNALTRATSALPRTTQRMYSRAVQDQILTTQKKIWLSDPATYPVIGICGGAMVFAGSYITYKFFSCPDVRCHQNKRGSELRYWSS